MPDHTVTAELYYGGAWHEVPVRIRDGITITRGRPDEAGQLTAATATLTLDNTGQVYDPRNPLSPLYGLAGRNTPARLLVDGHTRIVGEVSSWAPRRSLGYNQATGRGDAWTSIVVSGILRRLGQGAPLDSAARRTITALSPLAYWPLEDGEHASGAASAVAGVAPMRPIGTSQFDAPYTGAPLPPAGLPQFAAGTPAPGSLPVVSLSEGGRLDGVIPAHQAVSWELHWTMTLSVNGGAATALTAHPIRWQTAGQTWEVSVADDQMSVFIADTTGTAFGRIRLTDYIPYDGRPHHYAVATSQSGSNLATGLWIDGAARQVGVDAVDLVSPIVGSVESVRAVTVNPIEERGDHYPTGIGHIAYWSPFPTTAATEAAAWSVHGHIGEPAGRRVERLCTEHGVPFTATGDLDATMPMGPQRPLTLTALLAECEIADDGILTEPAGALGLHYRTRQSLYNQTPALTVDYTAGQLAPPLEPALDDLGLTNDVTAKDLDGSSARATLDVGPLGTADPPTGAGRYPTTLDVNPAGPAALPHLAGWALAKGTLDETRWPQVTVDLDAAPGLTATVDALSPGDVVALTGVQPDTATILVGQIVDTIGEDRRMVTITGPSATPYTVGVVADPVLGRADTDGSVLAADFDAGSDTTASVAVTAGPLWITTATHAAQFPFDIRCSGVRLTVTGISGASSPQTFTITASPVNGVAKTIDAGTPVNLWTPWRAAL